MGRVGLVTIGQSPRVDVVSEMREVVGERVEILECGALDKLSRERILELAPRENEEFFVTRLRDGSEVKVAVSRIVPLVQECINTLEPLVDVIGLICTGEFHGISSRKILIEPSALLINIVKSLSPRRLGVLVPNSRQVSMTNRKWSAVTTDIKVVSVSPYTGNEGEIKQAAAQMVDRDLVVLDCVGYSRRIKKVVAELTGKPVILPRTVIAYTIKELLEA
ncbi:MAG: AroM family protein [Sulfolobales archaeon]|nr:AroM family protein [Sulfolobales archaeon]MCX8208765.1 AroM family protein [Sulfolobales archaeon]MDW8010451.1 AroM family protein [Sulfolobales archaeon]